MSVREKESKDKKGFVADIIPRIICLFLAIVIWFYVVYNSAPDYEKSFEGIYDIMSAAIGGMFHGR